MLSPAGKLSIGTSPTSSVIYDDAPLGSPAIAITDNQNGFIPIQGDYTARLYSTPAATATLSQTGLIPVGTHSIQMDAFESVGAFTVTLGGDTISMSPVQTFVNYTEYEGNITGFSGQTANLSITEDVPSNPAIYPDLLELDNIVFSPVTVTPEPDSLVLIGIGGALFAAYRRFAPKRK